MRIVDSFPCEVREIEHLWIPLPDGSRLAARLWLPADAEERPVPAILEYIPYRKRAGTRARDEPMHRYFAGHGYAALRIDLRGSGESDGLLKDEYLPQEQEDGVAAIRWVASQSWCDGSVGMMGKSWGGFNSLQVAAHRPAELKAIISVCSTDDRYADDAHYMGGALLIENLIWGSVLQTLNAKPPDPELVGDRWRDIWLERLEEGPFFVENWLRHQRRDGYWKQGSVCEDFDAVACPVFAVGGWADGYTNAVPRLLAGLRVPRRGLVGPWAHVYPHQGVPGPAIGFLQEALRWWDHWLKGTDTGLMGEPGYRVWMQESVGPRSFYESRPGRWVAEESWPSPRIEQRRLWLDGRRLQPAPGADRAVEVLSPQTVGLAGGAWCGFGVSGELPLDQREDDGRSLTFDSEPLTEPIEILGAPELELELSASGEQALVCARLNDVAPGGASSRVSYGLLNLTHRDGHETPIPLESGRRYTVRLRLNDAAHAFPAGHRLRVAISTSYWPIAWPSASAVALRLHTASSSLLLPVRPPREEDGHLRSFEPAEGAPEPKETDLHDTGTRRTVRRDLSSGETVYTTATDTTPSGEPALTRIEPIGLTLGHSIVEEHRIRDDDPLSAVSEIRHVSTMGRGAWATRVVTLTRLRATAEAFLLEGEVDAWEGQTRVFSRRWERSVPRDGV